MNKHSEMPEDPLQVWTRFKEPMLRYGDVPGADLLLQERMLAPEDPYLRDVDMHVSREQNQKAALSGNSFHGNPPPAGSLPPLSHGRVPIAHLATGDVLSIPIDDLTKNALLTGPTGSGKTNSLRALTGSVIESNTGTVVVFDRKGGEVADCAYLAQPNLPLLLLNFSELMIAGLQPPRGISLSAFASSIVALIASGFNLFASRRLLIDTLDTLYHRPQPQATWPTLSHWMGMIEAIRVNALSRLGQYREACLYTLKQILRELGGAVDFVSSNMLDRLLSHRGCVIIATNGLSAEISSFLASLIINYAYQSREGAAHNSLEPLIFVLDDALPLVRGSTDMEIEGGINPISSWAFMGRSRKMGLCVAAQNFSLISPALRNNTDTVLCFGSYGRDAEEVGRHLSLTKEQAAMLPVIRPGEVIAIARSTWPLAVHGFVPEVP